MRVLLDTCVLSELTRPQSHAPVVEAIDSLPDENLFVSVLTLGEIAKGIALLNQTKRRNSLLNWLVSLQSEYADRILDVDTDTAKIWGELTAAAKKKGCAVGAVDGLIAATARRHGLHIMTRNVSDFEPTGALLINPWEKG